MKVEGIVKFDVGEEVGLKNEKDVTFYVKGYVLQDDQVKYLLSDGIADYIVYDYMIIDKPLI